MASKTSLRPRTIEFYGYLLRIHILPIFEGVPLIRLNSATIRVWNADLRVGSISETTAAKAYRLLRQILQAAADDRIIRENPCRSKGATKEHSQEREIPTLDQVNRVAEAIEPRYRAIVLLAALAELHKGECFGLARRHIDLEADPPTVRVERARVETHAFGMISQDPKSEAGIRTVALPSLPAAEFRELLDRWVAPDGDALVFTAEHSGDTPSKVVWRRAWGKARASAGVDCTFHDLRHVAGTLNAAAGATIKEAMARLDHASPEAARLYQHAAKSRDGEVASAVDRLFGG